MKKATEKLSTGIVTALRSGVFDQIVFARSELSRREKGENVFRDCVITGPDADTLRQPARLNFVPGLDGLCYAMPISDGESAPHPEKREGWLVLFVAPENSAGTAVWRPVGWYEEACFAESYQHRTEPSVPTWMRQISWS